MSQYGQTPESKSLSTISSNHNVSYSDILELAEFFRDNEVTLQPAIPQRLREVVLLGDGITYVNCIAQVLPKLHGGTLALSFINPDSGEALDITGFSMSVRYGPTQGDPRTYLVDGRAVGNSIFFEGYIEQQYNSSLKGVPLKFIVEPTNQKLEEALKEYDPGFQFHPSRQALDRIAKYFSTMHIRSGKPPIHHPSLLAPHFEPKIHSLDGFRAKFYVRILQTKDSNNSLFQKAVHLDSITLHSEGVRFSRVGSDCFLIERNSGAEPEQLQATILGDKEWPPAHWECGAINGRYLIVPRKLLSYGFRLSECRVLPLPDGSVIEIAEEKMPCKEDKPCKRASPLVPSPESIQVFNQILDGKEIHLNWDLRNQFSVGDTGLYLSCNVEHEGDDLILTFHDSKTNEVFDFSKLYVVLSPTFLHEMGANPSVVGIPKGYGLIFRGCNETTYEMKVFVDQKAYLEDRMQNLGANLKVDSEVLIECPYLTDVQKVMELAPGQRFIRREPVRAPKPRDPMQERLEGPTQFSGMVIDSEKPVGTPRAEIIFRLIHPSVLNRIGLPMSLWGFWVDYDGNILGPSKTTTERRLSQGMPKHIGPPEKSYWITEIKTREPRIGTIDGELLRRLKSEYEAGANCRAQYRTRYEQTPQKFKESVLEEYWQLVHPF